MIFPRELSTHYHHVACAQSYIAQLLAKGKTQDYVNSYGSFTGKVMS